MLAIWLKLQVFWAKHTFSIKKILPLLHLSRLLNGYCLHKGLNKAAVILVSIIHTLYLPITHMLLSGISDSKRDRETIKCNLEIPSLWELILISSTQRLLDLPFAMCSSLLLPSKYYSPQKYSNNAPSLLFLRGSSLALHRRSARNDDSSQPKCLSSVLVQRQCSCQSVDKGPWTSISNFKTETPTTLRTPWSLP